MTTCEFCGHKYPEECGRYGCPNCLGEGLHAGPGRRDEPEELEQEPQT